MANSFEYYEPYQKKKQTGLGETPYEYPFDPGGYGQGFGIPGSSFFSPGIQSGVSDNPSMGSWAGMMNPDGISSVGQLSGSYAEDPYGPARLGYLTLGLVPDDPAKLAAVREMDPFAGTRWGTAKDIAAKYGASMLGLPTTLGAKVFFGGLLSQLGLGPDVVIARTFSGSKCNSEYGISNRHV
jgi:hypothetical protein